MRLNEIYTSSDCVNYYQIYDINELIIIVLTSPNPLLALDFTLRGWPCWEKQLCNVVCQVKQCCED